MCHHVMVLRNRGTIPFLPLAINAYMVCLIYFRAHAQAAANMQQQQQQPPHTSGGLAPGMMHPASHSPLQLQPHIPGLYIGRDVAQARWPRFMCCWKCSPCIGRTWSGSLASESPSHTLRSDVTCYHRHVTRCKPYSNIAVHLA